MGTKAALLLLLLPGRAEDDEADEEAEAEDLRVGEKRRGQEGGVKVVGGCRACEWRQNVRGDPVGVCVR